MELIENGCKKKEAGIYKILNILNSNYYIGSTIQLDRRRRQHLYLLNKNKHHSQRLQNAWNKYGSGNFIFCIVQNTEVCDRAKIEQQYLDSSFGKDECYNSSPKAEPHARDTRSKEELKKIFGRVKSAGERKKISSSRKGIRILKDRGYCKETVEILRLVMENKDLPNTFRTDKEVLMSELRTAYNKWPTGSKDLYLRKLHKAEKIKIKLWLQEQDMWYDARSDSWNRKSDADKENALRNLSVNWSDTKQFKRY